RSVLNQSNLNQDQVNQSSKRTSNTTTMPDSQEVKGVAVKSNLNNEVGEKLKSQSSNKMENRRSCYTLRLIEINFSIKSSLEYKLL
ncbi:hypothetical protein OLT88_06500, partial [Campylobacter jejuni]|nr:hypothetical protein [Campylobacter jejuni]